MNRLFRLPKQPFHREVILYITFNDYKQTCRDIVTVSVNVRQVDYAYILSWNYYYEWADDDWKQRG